MQHPGLLEQGGGVGTSRTAVSAGGQVQTRALCPAAIRGWDFHVRPVQAQLPGSQPGVQAARPSGRFNGAAPGSVAGGEDVEIGSGSSGRGRGLQPA